MNHRLPLLLLGLSFLLLSCVKTHYLSYEANPRDPKPDNYPMEILDTQSLKSEFKVIGEITIFADVFSSSEDMKKELFGRARKMGGDAIIDFQSTPPSGNQSQEKNGTNYNGNGVIWKGKVVVLTK